MCKIIVKADEAKVLVSTISVLASKDAVMELIAGVKVAENQMFNLINVINKTEQVSYQFVTAKPADYTEGQQYMRLILKAADFCNIASCLVGESDIYICDGQKGTFIGVDKVSQLQIKKLDASAMPDKIAMDKNDVLMQIKADVPAFTECLKIGSTMVDPNSSTQGINNAVLAVTYSGNEGPAVPGQLKCYSTNGNAFTRGVSKVTVANEPKFMERLNAHLQGKSSYKASVPKKSMNNLLKLLSGAPDCIISFTSKHVGVMIGRSTMYTFTLGAEASKIYDTVDGWDDITKENTFVVDAEAIREQLQLLDKVVDLSGVKSPIIFNVNKGNDLILELADKAGIVKVKTVAQKLSAESFRIGFNPKMLISIISSLKKGNLRISSCPIKAGSPIEVSPIEISNGTVDANADNSGIAFLLPVKIGEAKAEQPKEKKEEVKAEEKVEEKASEPTPETVDATTTEAPVEGMEDVGSEDVPFDEAPVTTAESEEVATEAAGEQEV